MGFISERIGSEYLTWKDQFILISTRTGSGKTQFILRDLLTQAIEQNKYVLYICNRKLLRDQVAVRYEEVAKELFGESLSEKQHTHLIVRTYQFFECSGFDTPLSVPGCVLGVGREDILYYVWDEAHYLGTESFNPSFNYWFNQFFKGAIGFPHNPGGTHIFLTATPKPLKLFLAAHLRVPDGKDAIPERITEAAKRKNFNKEYGELLYAFQEKWKLYGEADETEAEKDIVKNIVNKKPGESTCTIEEKIKTPEEKKNLQKKADKLREQARNIQPEKAFAEHLQDIANRLCSFTVVKTEKPLLIEYADQDPSPYKTMPTTYCTCLSDLLGPIEKAVQKKEKFVVFVNNIEAGKDLAKDLAGRKITARIRTAKENTTNMSCAVKSKCDLVKDGRFDEDVLIATSVLDCGVNIHDDAVKHVAIRHADQTTFLQMLGRKRLQEGEHIHLYIIAFHATSIEAMRKQMLKDLKEMVLYKHKDDKGLISNEDFSQGINAERALACVRNQYGEAKQKSLGAKIIEGDFKSKLYYSRTSIRKESTLEEILAEYIVGPSGMIRRLCQLHELQEVIEQAGPERDLYFYLNYQLSWLDQDYDISRWIGISELIDYLESNMNRHIICVGKGRTANPDELSWDDLDSEEFIRTCAGYVPLITSRIKKYVGKNHVPGVRGLNFTLQELKLHYRIQSKQVKRLHCSVWIIHRIYGPIAKIKEQKRAQETDEILEDDLEENRVEPIGWNQTPYADAKKMQLSSPDHSAPCERDIIFRTFRTLLRNRNRKLPLLKHIL